MVLTYDGSSLKIYQDGQLGGELPATGPLWYSSDDFYIGIATPARPAQHWEGDIDDVRIYNRTLSASEVAQLCGFLGSDTTPPTITSAVSPAPNGNGWNNTDVKITFNATDAGSGVEVCDPPITVTTEGAGQVFAGSATDKAGNIGTTSVTVNIDKTAPMVLLGAADPAPNDAGWNNTPVRIPFSATDALSGIDVAISLASPLVLDSEGASVTAEAVAFDLAGNITKANSPAVKIDKTAPAIELTLPGTSTYLLNETVVATWSATDILSGLAGAEMGTLPLDTSVVGEGKTFTAPKGLAKDNAGNTSDATDAVYDVIYGWGEIQQPVNADGSSVFKLKSTVPVKFKLYDGLGNSVTTAMATIYVSKIDDSIVGYEIEAVSTASATTGNLFRYDAAEQQYVFNLATKNLSIGTWRIRIHLNDGKDYAVEISLM
jgi:hypothetical protein